MKAPEVRLRVCGLAVRGGAFLAVEHEKGGRRYYMLPGGGVDPGERLAGSLARELREELGVEARAGNLLMACDTIAPDASRHIVHLVFAMEVQGDARATGSDARVVGAAWLTARRLGEVEFYPDIVEWLKRALQAGPEGATVLAPQWK